jgi:hypothetical protein
MFEDKVCIFRLCLQVQSSLATPNDLFVLNEAAAPLQEEYNGLNVSYPDFFNEDLREWFSSHINSMTQGIEDILGGFVLQDNWPASNTKHNTSADMAVVEVSYRFHINRYNSELNW